MGLTFWEPETLSEAIEKLNEFGPRARLLAGGTDLLVLFERGQVELEHVISLAKVPGLSGIVERNGDGPPEIVIGAMTTHRAIERSALLQGPYAALPTACGTVGSIQIRNVGTLGGNLCNASPAADTAPALLALEARVMLTGPHGSRTMDLEQFLVGPRQTALLPGEMLTRIHLPRVGNNTTSRFLKVGRRKAMEIAIVCVAARITLADDGETCQAVRIGLGAVAPTAIRARAAEDLLTGNKPAPSLLYKAGSLATEAANPITDVRASAEYRRHLVAVLTRRALEACLAQRQGITRSA